MLAAADLIAPKGLVEGASMFPKASSADLVERMQSYLEDGYVRGAAITDVDPDVEAAKKDDAARAWAYHRAFHAVYVRMSANPTSMSVAGDGSASYTLGQIQEFKRMSDDYLSAHLALIPSDVGGTIPSAPITTAVTNRFSF